MKINEVEQKVGITKKNIRFYEEQGLIHPSRNRENGYRDYSNDEVESLNKIKLLRKLSVPIEEIRKIQENNISLAECLERHAVYLNHEEKNLSIMKEMCEKINEEEDSFESLKVEQYLEEMSVLEEGGTQFMDVKKRDQKKKYGPLIATAVVIVFMGVVIALQIWGEIVEPMPIPLFLIFLAIPFVVIVGTVMALIQRLKEIEGGEENEASKY